MNNSLDPNQYGELRGILKVVGPAVVAVGGLLAAVGLISFFAAFGAHSPPRYFWCAFVGLPLVAVGIGLTKFAYLGAISRYIAGEVAPVGKDVTNYMVAGTRDSIRDVAAAVGEGLAAVGTEGASGIVRCQQCNAETDASANFCSGCGLPLSKSRACQKCGQLVDGADRFCSNCGTSVA